MAARGINDQDAPPKLQEFLRLALKHHPINVGNAIKGGIYPASQNLTPLAHWRRTDAVDPEEVVKGIDACTTAAAVFDRSANLEAFLRDLQGRPTWASRSTSAPSRTRRAPAANGPASPGTVWGTPWGSTAT